MASVGGDKYDPKYQIRTPINPGNNLASATNRYANFETHMLNATTLNVDKRILAPTIIFGQGHSAAGGPITVTNLTPFYTLSGPIGDGWIYVYNANYTATVMCSFHYDASVTTWTFGNTMNSGLTITLSFSTTSLRASVTGTMDIYYKIIFHTNTISNV